MNKNIETSKRKSIIIALTTMLFMAIMCINIFTDAPLRIMTTIESNKLVQPESGSSLAIAMNTTKSECSPNVWREWSPLEGELNQAIGYADLIQIELNNGEWIRIITAHIDPIITDSEKISHVAWHECAHTVIYSLEEKEMKKLSEELKRLYPHCDSIHECFADTMAYAKTRSIDHAPYEDKVTLAQLELAHEVWELNDKSISVNYNYDKRLFLDKYSM